MKRKNVIIPALVLAIALTGCSGKKVDYNMETENINTKAGSDISAFDDSTKWNDSFSVETSDKTASDIEFELKVKEVDDKKVVFEPVSDMSAVSDAQIFSMEVTRPAIENAVYVQKDAVHEKDGRYFVYTLDENGYRQAVWISAGDQVGDYRIITEGLKSGDEVVLQ